jgi:hypothetical protein
MIRIDYYFAYELKKIFEDNIDFYNKILVFVINVTQYLFFSFFNFGNFFSDCS